MICAIYARKSADQSGVSEVAKSVTRQIEHAKAYATKKGWTLDDKAVRLDTPTDKMMVALWGFTDESERTRAGHVTGGRCFG
jgi:hypothetical protein